jgi:hypothetical protein
VLSVYVGARHRLSIERQVRAVLEHHPAHGDVHHAGLGVVGDAVRAGDERRGVAGGRPGGDRQRREVDGVAFEHRLARQAALEQARLQRGAQGRRPALVDLGWLDAEADGVHFA